LKLFQPLQNKSTAVDVLSAEVFKKLQKAN